MGLIQIMEMATGTYDETEKKTRAPSHVRKTIKAEAIPDPIPDPVPDPIPPVIPTPDPTPPSDSEEKA